MLKLARRVGMAGAASYAVWMLVLSAAALSGHALLAPIAAECTSWPVFGAIMLAQHIRNHRQGV